MSWHLPPGSHLAFLLGGWMSTENLGSPPPKLYLFAGLSSMLCAWGIPKGEFCRNKIFLWRPRMSFGSCMASHIKMTLCLILPSGRLDKYLGVWSTAIEGCRWCQLFWGQLRMSRFVRGPHHKMALSRILAWRKVRYIPTSMSYCLSVPGWCPRWTWQLSHSSAGWGYTFIHPSPP